MVDDKEKSDVAPKATRQPIKDCPTSERPREKLLQLGPEALSDGELLAVLLRIGKSGQSAEDLGRHLLNQFNGISGIDRAYIFLFEPRNQNDKVPFDLTTFKYVPISQAAEIPNKIKPEIIAILSDAGAPI